MARQSAGILLYRLTGPALEVFLVHPGGPYFAGKDAGVWSIPKGEYGPEEEAMAAARREFEEETGSPVEGTFIPLAPVKQKGGKQVHAWAVEGDMDAAGIRSNTFRMEYPYKSGKWINVPEVDEAGWFNLPTARLKINPAQVAFLDELEQHLRSGNLSAHFRL